ncbi:hypothetical protein BRADI_1g68471v3 [Brachypodium distachyon]|uniref:DUF4283 domain-containing protein n=1 Tax=Brachypodium distachyon TaxID=15368 RepID=A0A2K2DU18_BRADI|nr:hypothetical protein BRADI_1g68471v3 [Brachypodium distachyon]
MADLPELGELTEIWLQINGIPPKWCTWKVITQVFKCFGLLLDVDWNEIFKSMYATVRVKLAVRNLAKIPPARMVVMKKKFYPLQFTVEWEGVDIDRVMGLKDKDYNGDDDYEDDNIMDDEIQDLEKNRDTLMKNHEKSDPKGTKIVNGGSKSAPPKTNYCQVTQPLINASLVESEDEEESGDCNLDNPQHESEDEEESGDCNFSAGVLLSYL